MTDVLLKARRHVSISHDLKASWFASDAMQIERKFKIWLFIVFAAMLMTVVIPFRTVAWTQDIDIELQQSEDNVAGFQQLLLLLRDAESGQRGFAITGKESFLEPYHTALARIDPVKQKIKSLHTNSIAPGEMNQALALTDMKLAELAETIELRRSGGFGAVEPVISSAKGKEYMDRIGALVGAWIERENGRRAQLSGELQAKTRVAAYINLGAVLVGMALLAIVLTFIFQMMREREASSLALEKSSRELNAGLAELERRNSEIETMAKMNQAIESAASLKETTEIIAIHCAKLLPAFSGGLYLFRNSRDLVVREEQWGPSASMPDAMELNDCWGLRKGHPHMAGKGDLCCTHYSISGGDERHLCIPLIAQGEVLGMISLELSGAETGAAAPHREEVLVHALSEQVALGLSNARLREMLRQQSIVDPLTGLFNRRYMDETLKRELSRAARKSMPVSVILLDVDHFKKVNDTYGHDVGDAVLAAVSNCLKSGIREGDLACRFGGEELVLVLPECGKDDAVLRAEALRQAIPNVGLQSGSHPAIRVTASFGVATFPGNGKEAAALLQAADHAMYAAKRSGRDRVVAAG